MRALRGVVVCAALVAPTGCESAKVPISAPSVDSEVRSACANLVAALPDTVNDELRRPVDPDDALGAGWGDPAIVLVCGVPKPTGQDLFASCTEANGVGWWAPDDQVADAAVDLVMTTVGTTPLVQVTLPAAYRPEGAAAVMVDLAPAIRKHVETPRPCR